MNMQNRLLMIGSPLLIAILIAMGFLVHSNIALNNKLNVMMKDTGGLERVAAAEQAAAPEQNSWELLDPATPLEAWDPFREMEAMQRRIDQIFGDAFQRFSMSPRFEDFFRGPGFTPNLDFIDEEKRYIVRVDIPGADESNIDVAVEGNTLRISAESRQEQVEETNGKVLRKERRVGRFERAVTLPEPVDAATMQTEYKDGVLTVSIEKKA